MATLTPTLTQIEYALAIAQQGSFRAAAQACHVSQPALSAQVAKLEDQLGVVLFDRSTRPVIVTDIGAQLMPRFDAIVAAVREVEEVAAARGPALAGPFRLGIIPTMAPYILPRLLPDFLAEHPQVEITVRELTTEEIVAELQSDRLDAGILATPLRVAGVHEQRLFDEPLYVYASARSSLLSGAGRKRKSLRPDELPVQELIVMTEGHCLRTQVLDVCALALQDTDARHGFSLETGSMSTLIRMIDTGPWLSVLPQLALDELPDDARKRRVFSFAGSEPYREVGLVYRRPTYRAAIRDALAQAVSELAPRGRRRGKGVEPRRVEPLAG